MTVGPYQFFLVEVNGVEGPNFRGVQANFDVMKKAHHVTNLYPEKRIYTVRDMVMTKVDIHPGLFVTFISRWENRLPTTHGLCESITSLSYAGFGQAQ